MREILIPFDKDLFSWGDIKSFEKQMETVLSGSKKVELGDIHEELASYKVTIYVDENIDIQELLELGILIGSIRRRLVTERSNFMC